MHWFASSSLSSSSSSARAIVVRQRAGLRVRVCVRVCVRLQGGGGVCGFALALVAATVLVLLALYRVDE